MQKIKLIGWLLVVCLVAGIFLALPDVRAEAPWLTGWNRRELFYWQGGTPLNASLGVQGSLTVLNQTGFSSSTTFYIYNETLTTFEDLRVTQNDGTTVLPVWNQTTNRGLNCTFWAEFPSVNASYFLYWNNPSASNVWNQTAVFIDVIGGVVGAWNMEEANAADPVVDYSGNGNTGTATGTTIGTGKYAGKNGRVFNGTGEKILLTNKIDLPNGWTIIATFKRSGNSGGTGGQHGIVYCFYGDVNNYLQTGTMGTISPVYNSLRTHGVPEWLGDQQSITNDANFHLIGSQYDPVTKIIKTIGDTVITAGTSHTDVIYTGAFVPVFGRLSATAAFANGVLSGIIFFNTPAINSTQIGNIYANYPDVVLEAGKVLARNYVYPLPSVSLFGSVESAPPVPTPSPSPSSTPDPNALTIDDAVGLAVVGVVFAIALPMAFVVYKKRQTD